VVDNSQDQKWVVFFNGNAALLQGCDSVSRKQIAEGQNMLEFNYRNTGGSTGKPTSYKDLVVDGLAQIDYLISKGVKPGNITL
jgi:hypothetical protein